MRVDIQPDTIVVPAYRVVLEGITLPQLEQITRQLGKSTAGGASSTLEIYAALEDYLMKWTDVDGE